MTWFNRVAKNINGRSILWIFILICSQIWLHIPVVIATLITSQNWPKAKTLPMCECHGPWHQCSEFSLLMLTTPLRLAVARWLPNKIFSVWRLWKRQKQRSCGPVVLREDHAGAARDLRTDTSNVRRGGGLASCRILLLPEEPYMNVFFLKKFVCVAKVAIIHRKM